MRTRSRSARRRSAQTFVGQVIKTNPSHTSGGGFDVAAFFAGGDYLIVGNKASLNTAADGNGTVPGNTDPVRRWVGQLGALTITQMNLANAPYYNAARNSVSLEASGTKFIRYEGSDLFAAGTPFTIVLQCSSPTGWQNDQATAIFFDGNVTGGRYIYPLAANAPSDTSRVWSFGAPGMINEVWQHGKTATTNERITLAITSPNDGVGVDILMISIGGVSATHALTAKSHAGQGGYVWLLNNIGGSVDFQIHGFGIAPLQADQTTFDKIAAWMEANA